MTHVAADWVESHLGVVQLTASRDRPWASVWLVEAADGHWWLKENRAGTTYEPALLGLLSRTAPDLLPDVRVHPTQPWSLLADAGRSVREVGGSVPQETLITFWCGLLARYGDLQRQVGLAELRAAGVPDLGADRLVATYEGLLAEPGWLAPSRTRDLSGAQVAAVRSCGRRLAEAARQLAHTRPPTVQHDDLHGSNVFVPDSLDAGSARIIDWGDASVDHPFGTLRVCLDVLAHELELDRDSPPLRRVRDAYLEGWRTAGESNASLLDELDLVLQVAPLVRAASCARALGAPPDDPAYAGWVASWLLRLARGLAA